MDAEKEQLRAEVRELRARITELQARDGERDTTLQVLREKVTQLEALLEESRRQAEKTIRTLREKVTQVEALLEKARREGKRQAAPFRKAEGPKPDPQRPGRKSGSQHGRHAHREAIPPEVIDEEYEAPLPEHCPTCGSRDLEEKAVVVQYQTEIPRRPIHRQFNIHRGECRGCGRPVQGRHPLQTSDAVGAAASQLGPEAHSAIAIMNKQLGLSHGKVADCFQQLFGISIARATSARSMLRTAKRCEPAYGAIRAAVHDSPLVVPDETGWRVGGCLAWLHVLVGQTATYYEIASGRGHEVAEGVLGKDWSGTMTHDGWAPYDYFQQAFHQQCLRHLVNRCQEILETAVGGAVCFPRRVLEQVDTAFAVRREYEAGRLSADQIVDEALTLAGNLEELAEGRFTYEPNRRLAKHLAKHSIQWFWFLIEPETDATNYRAEQALRPGVANRKVWGGNRTWVGAKAQSILTSVLRTCAQVCHGAVDFLVRTLCAPRPDPALLLGR
jgi:transposase